DGALRRAPPPTGGRDRHRVRRAERRGAALVRAPGALPRGPGPPPPAAPPRGRGRRPAPARPPAVPPRTGRPAAPGAGIVLLVLAAGSAQTTSPRPTVGVPSLTVQVSLEASGAATVSLLSVGLPFRRVGPLARDVARTVFPDAGGFDPPTLVAVSSTGSRRPDHPVFSATVGVRGAFAVGPEPRLRIAGRPGAALAARR